MTRTRCLMGDRTSSYTGSAASRSQRFVASPAPYHVGEVAEYDDLPEDESALAPIATRVRELFDRGRSRGSDARRTTTILLPTLPDEADALSFGIAALIDIEAPRRQELLVSRLASERLETLEQLLAGAVDSLEARAKVHGRSKSNGRGPVRSPRDDAYRPRDQPRRDRRARAVCLRRPSELVVYRSDGLPGYSKQPRLAVFRERATSWCRR